MCVAALQRKRVSPLISAIKWYKSHKYPKSVFVNRPASAFHSDHYAFVTFYDMNDAFAAIDNGSKLRRPDELPFDLCFGGRRQFCNSDYADLGKIGKEKSRARMQFVSIVVLCIQNKMSEQEVSAS